MVVFQSSEGLKQNTLRVKRGFTYTYYTAPAKQDKPTLLCLHGWPDEAREWFGLAKDFLLPAGYGVVIPDCLGYAGTDKPRDPKQYSMGAMVGDLVDILDREKLSKVIVLGHDWGAAFASRFYNYAPARCSALATVCVAYSAPYKAPIDLKKVNDTLESLFGMRCYEYMHFFASDESDAVCEANVGLMFDLIMTDDWPGAAKMIFSKNKIPDVLKANEKTFRWHPRVAQQDKDDFVERFTRDGFNGAFNWYRYFAHHMDAKAETDAVSGDVVDVPTLYVGYEGDLVCRKETVQGALMKGHLPHLTNVTLQGGHWGLVQEPEPFGKTVIQWLDKIERAGKL